MKLSVIIPVYNVEETLSECFRSVVGSLTKDAEVILVDDGSTDSSGRMCDELASKSRADVKVVHKQNGGLSSARNAGLDIASGDYIAFVDSDDKVDAEIFNQLVDELDSNQDIDVLEFGVKYCKGEKCLKTLAFNEMVFDSPKDYWLQCNGYNHAYAWNKIFRHSLIRNVRFPDGKNFEDVWFMADVMKKTPIISTSTVVGYNYNSNSNGITANASGDDLESLLEGHLAMAKTLNVDFMDANTDKWYLKLLNIQLDVNRMKGSKPILPQHELQLAMPATFNEKIKIAILNSFGIDTLCKFNKWAKKVFSSVL